MCYLMLSVAGHLTIFLTRTRGPFWSIPPARILWMAVVGTQILATLIAVYGFLMPPLGWKWAGFVWAYALVWAFVSDQVKLLAYRILDPVKPKSAGEDKPQTKTGDQDNAEAKASVHAAPELATT
jgi:H+-transporting ATPase